MWYSGIDQHKAYCVITTYGPDGPRASNRPAWLAHRSPSNSTSPRSLGRIRR